jgi:oxygen-independent coproporphyrinogen-3 oxidase
MAGLYLHIPFCKQACHYCNFHFATSLRQKPELVQAMEQELIGRAPDWKSEIFQTIYFGGGTPSLLDMAELNSLLGTIQSYYAVGADPEITLEANPDDIHEEKLLQWQASGINRLSLGIQSFADQDLRWMNRVHQAEQALQALRSALRIFPNLTADLIYGTPGLSDAQWEKNVNTLIELGVPHISAYALTVEPKTPLEKQIRLKQKPEVDTDQQARQYLWLMERLNAAGYEHYEISNFAKPGYRSRHNSSYWQGISYLGIGPSAHSYLPPQRSWQVANNQQYIDQIKQANWIHESERLTPAQQLNETVMIALRTLEGLDLQDIGPSIQQKWKTRLDAYEKNGLLIRRGNKLQLTPQGRLQADGIAASFFVEETDQIN